MSLNSYSLDLKVMSWTIGMAKSNRKWDKLGSSPGFMETTLLQCSLVMDPNGISLLKHLRNKLRLNSLRKIKCDLWNNNLIKNINFLKILIEYLI